MSTHEIKVGNVYTGTGKSIFIVVELTENEIRCRQEMNMGGEGKLIDHFTNIHDIAERIVSGQYRFLFNVFDTVRRVQDGH